jgi:hypothetical protein
MGIFDLFKNALANEDLPPPPPDGLSSDPWLSVSNTPLHVALTNTENNPSEHSTL